MSKTVAKRYVKALMEAFNDQELKSVTQNLSELSQALNTAKVKTIISSPDIDRESKKEFILSLLKNPDKKFVNFINILGEHKRLLLLKAIYEELVFQISLKNNKYEGKIYTNSQIDKEQIEKLQTSFSKKFGANISLEAVKSNYTGLKIEIDDLGVETSFSLERLKAQMTEHILKAI